MGDIIAILGSVVGVVVAGFVLVLLPLIIAKMFRRVVSTNDVHIVQSGKATVSYGKGQDHGNVYYAWPSWIPRFGVKVIQLPVSVFDVNLKGYEAYDKGRLPFVVDVIAFFRVTNSNIAAERVHDFNALRTQLQSVLQGSIRTILASYELQSIMEGRSEFGNRFTQEVDKNLAEWGVQTVKMIELMDLRDSENSKVIANIMSKKKSEIEAEARIAVAQNAQKAAVAETESKQAVDIRNQEAEQAVGLRKAEVAKEVGIANQRSHQQVLQEEKTTSEKAMDVKRVNEVKQAEINRDVQVVVAEQQKQVSVVTAEGQKQVAVTTAEGQKQVFITEAEGKLEAQRKQAEGIKAIGEAEGAAETAKLMAPVTTQVELANKIGANKEYQTYLITIEQIKAGQAVGMEQAKALQKAGIKIITNAGTPQEGVKSVMDLFSPMGGTAAGAALEALANTDMGKELLDKVLKK